MVSPSRQPQGGLTECRMQMTECRSAMFTLRVFPADRQLHHHLITSCGCGADKRSQHVPVTAAAPHADSYTIKPFCLCLLSVFTPP